MRTQYFGGTNERNSHMVYCFVGNRHNGQSINQSSRGIPDYWNRKEMTWRFACRITQKQAEKIVGRENLRNFVKSLKNS